MISNWEKMYGATISSSTKVVSVFGGKGATGTFNDPMCDVDAFATRQTYILGVGTFYCNVNLVKYPHNIDGTTLYGMGMYNSQIEFTAASIEYGLQNMTLKSLKEINIGYSLHGSYTNYIGIRFIAPNIAISKTVVRFASNLIIGNLSTIYASQVGTNNTFVGTEFSHSAFKAADTMSANLYHDCNIDILNNLSTTHKAFNNCRFRIGNESSYTAITVVGVDNPTQAQLRDEYVARCVAQGITETNTSRCIFSTDDLDSLFVPQKNGVIDQQARQWGNYLGYQTLSTSIRLTSDITAQSFNDIEGVSNGITVSNGLITASPEADISHALTKQSTLLVFNTVKSIDKLNITSNLPASILASTVKPITKIATTDSIKIGVNYLVGSIDGTLASVEYNGAIYTSDRSANNYIFRGVDSFDELEKVSSNAVVYRVVDYVNIPSIGIRYTMKPSTFDVISGKLKNGYWYLVAQGCIEYNGKAYPENSSFIADATTEYTDLGNCRLHEVFIDNETQNPFIDVFTVNPSVAMSNFTEPKIGSDGKPIGSSHPEYAKVLNEGYIELFPAGRIFQLKVGIISNN